MMKYLCPEVPWENIKAIGFDMDGTLYDEFDFIFQVYEQISKIFSSTDQDVNKVMNLMLSKWLEKGSSYPFIFSETAITMGLDSNLQEKKIDEALRLFRNFNPAIILPARIKFLLENLKLKYSLFLVSDGSTALQWNKIKTLALENYFERLNIFVSGDYDKGAEKPNLTSLDHISIFNKNINKNDVVFIGDRAVDEIYAKNAGFHFVNINSIFNKK